MPTCGTSVVQNVAFACLGSFGLVGATVEATVGVGEAVDTAEEKVMTMVGGCDLGASCFVAISGVSGKP